MKLYYMICLGILGAILGSFLSCMGYRIPNKIKTTYPSSFCPSCKKSLKWYMNIPIISYILLKGRCYYCKEKIGFIYFLCEILLSLLFMISYKLFGFDLKFMIFIILSCALIVTIVSDFLYYYISDRVLILSVLGIIICYFIYLEPMDILLKIISGIIVLLIMIGIKIMGNAIFKKESMGDGDIKLMGVVGISLGLMGSFISLFLSSLLALLFSLFWIKKKKDKVIPFGPFILIATLIVIILNPILETYIYSLF